jgi:glycosyltransferase 2 family protein
VGHGLGLPIPSIALFVIVPMILCLSSVPITPGGLGVRENLYVLMLAVVKLPKTEALSVSLIASAQGIFWSLVGGLIYMGARQKERLSEVTQNDGDAKEN